MIDYNDYREMQDAFSKCDLKNSATPKSISGKFVDDVDTYNKAQALLKCVEMEEAHGYLYDIDFDHLTDRTAQKVDDLFKLAIEKGFIEDPNPPAEEEKEDESEEVTECDNGISNETAWVCLYSATKNGEIKTGECYSNAKDPQSAKADAISKLTGLGFNAIEIIAIEAGDPAAIGSSPVSDFTVPSIPASEQGVIYPEDEIRITEDEILVDNENKKSDKTDDKDSDTTPTEDVEKEEPGEEPAEVEEEPAKDEKEELSNEDKLELFHEYLDVWKTVLKLLKVESYSDMTIDEKADFWKTMAAKWPSDKVDPRDFMGKDNVKKLETLRIEAGNH